MSAPLRARALRLRLGGRPALDGVDLTVEAGTVHALLGLNGAGKTTLMRLLLGMQTPEGGEALVLGVPARTAPPRVWRDVGHHVESPFAYPDLTARENLRLVGRLVGLARPRADARIDALADALRFEPWLDRRAATLSLGTRQKVGLAGALLHEPGVLVLDEPSNALDPLGIVTLRRLLREAAGAGAAVLVASHQLDEVARVADRMTVLHRGRVAGTLDPRAADPGRDFFDLLLGADAPLDQAAS